MTKKNAKKQTKHTFFIREDISELEKVSTRQKLVSELSEVSLQDLKELNTVAFPIEQVGTKNCENLVGSVEIPIGVVGPITADVTYIPISRTNEKNLDTSLNSSITNIQTKEKLSFIIPLATTEGALIASVHRGLKALCVGKTSVVVKKIGMSRSVVFELESAQQVHEYISFFKKHETQSAKFCEETSTHLKYISLETFTRGKLAFFRFVFDTDEAMGMNMVTIALSHAWKKFELEYLVKQDTFTVELLTLSGNVCTDKKDSAINRIYGRGYAVTVETRLSKNDVKKLLKVTPEKITKTHVVKNLIGSNIAGSLSQNMHVANALAAFYLATGQDVAHTVAGSEASVHFEVTNSGGLYVSLTMPNVSVGCVGGGTWLPAQTQARSIIKTLGKRYPSSKTENNPVTAKDLATVVGLACLAGELSGMAALSNHTLASAHEKFGRNKKGGK